MPRMQSLSAVCMRHMQGTFSTGTQPSSVRSASSVICHSYPASGSPKSGGPSSRTIGVPSSSNSCAVSGHRKKRLPLDVHALVYADFTSALVRLRIR